jgi:hypothetical protein
VHLRSQDEAQTSKERTGNLSKRFYVFGRLDRIEIQFALEIYSTGSDILQKENYGNGIGKMVTEGNGFRVVWHRRAK